MIKLKGGEAMPKKAPAAKVPKPVEERAPLSAKQASLPARKAKGEEEPRAVLVKLPPGLWDRVDKEWHRRELMSRTATVQVLLEEALAK